ncbi:MAG: hypothetical protein Q7V62_08640 [Actinomycetota bacterium]|nr:hypothetical protein [Actinomycetota bacterium]
MCDALRRTRTYFIHSLVQMSSPPREIFSLRAGNASPCWTPHAHVGFESAIAALEHAWNLPPAASSTPAEVPHLRLAAVTGALNTLPGKLRVLSERTVSVLTTDADIETDAATQRRRLRPEARQRLLEPFLQTQPANHESAAVPPPAPRAE